MGDLRFEAELAWRVLAPESMGGHKVGTIGQTLSPEVTCELGAIRLEAAPEQAPEPALA